MTETAYDIASNILFNYITAGEVDCLHRLAGLVPADPKAIMVNIGAGIGISGLALREGNAVARLVTIDYVQESPIGGLNNEAQAFARAGLPPPEQILSASILAGERWSEGPVDLVFVDGDHHAEAVRGDIQAWMPHVREGGILAFHDYDNLIGIVWTDVRDVVNTLVKPYYPVIEQTERIIAFRRPYA